MNIERLELLSGKGYEIKRFVSIDFEKIMISSYMLIKKNAELIHALQENIR